jgi:hypothetical protein
LYRPNNGLSSRVATTDMSGHNATTTASRQRRRTRAITTAMPRITIIGSAQLK